MPLLKGSSKKVVSQNISEFHHGPTYAKTLRKFGSKKANAQAVAAALSTARKYAKKAEGGGELRATSAWIPEPQPPSEEPQQDPRMSAIGIRPVEPAPENSEAMQAQQAREAAAARLAKGVKSPLSERQPAGLTEAIQQTADHLGEGLVNWVATPGRLKGGPRQVEHKTPGFETEEESFLQDLADQEYQREMTDFGAGTAMGMVGMSRFFGTPQNAVGIGGGKIIQPQPPHVHPQPNGYGEQVQIKTPTQPSTQSSWFNKSGVATFVPGQKIPHGEALNGIPFKPWTPPEGGWVEHFSNYDDPIHETPFVDHPTKQAASGVVILEPDGRMWLTAPTNQFGGYKSTFPKGKLDPGLTMQENAIKEAYEETGFKVRLMGQLADVDKTTSRTRYYLATRESGTPAAMGWESQGLHLVPWSKSKEFLNNPLDHQVLDALTKKADEMKAKGATPAPEPAPPEPTTPQAPTKGGLYFGKYFHPYDLNPEDVKKFTFQKSNYETGGSNPGGVYHAPDGTPVYIKQFEGEAAIERTYNEKLANELLKLTGVPVANVRMTQLKGHPAIASDMVPGKELNTVSPTKYANLEGLRSHYPAHLWTGNYDFVGTGKNNIMVMPNGQTIHIDPGGALRYRAQGKLKGPDMWGPNVEHFKMTPGKDLTDVMGEHYNNISMMSPSAQRVANVTDQQIHDLVQQYGPLQKGEKAKLEETLKARRDGVAKLYGVDKGGTSAPPTPAPKVDAKPAPKSELADQFGNSSEVKAKAIIAHAKGDLDVIDHHIDLNSKLYGDEYGKAVEAEIQKQITPASPKKYTYHGMTLTDPEKMVEVLKKQPGTMTQKILDLSQKYGDEYANAVLKKVQDDAIIQQQVKDFKAKDHPEHDPNDYAYDDDIEPPEHITSEDLGQGAKELKFQGKPWFGKNTKEQVAGDWDTHRIEQEMKKGDGVIQILNNKQWVDEYRPPTKKNHQHVAAPNAISNPTEGGFNQFVEFHHNTPNAGSSGYLEKILDPKNKQNAPGFSYGNEHALYGLDYPFTGYNWQQTGPYLMNPEKVAVAYWPNFFGKTLAETKNNGEGAFGGMQKKIIAAAQNQGVDLVVLHGMNDVGGINQTQYLVINNKILRAKDAQFDPAKFGKTAIDPATGHEYSHTMWGIAGASAVGAGLAKGQKQDEDKKMARGGKVKFKPFSSIEIKPRRTPKTIIRAEAGKKALRIAKHYARGGATEPQPHEFINFKKGGMINSNIPGRTDKIPMKVATGAYVLPADIPSALGQGNTMAGKTILDKMFNSGPYGLPLNKGKGSKFQMPHLKGFANGGEADHVPIIAAGGEYIIHPDEVQRQGNGDMKKGHKVLDQFVLHTRKEHIKTLKSLKPPK